MSGAVAVAVTSTPGRARRGRALGCASRRAAARRHPGRARLPGSRRRRRQPRAGAVVRRPRVRWRRSIRSMATAAGCTTRPLGIAHLAPDGTVRPIVELAPPDVKMNDAACDPQPAVGQDDRDRQWRRRPVPAGADGAHRADAGRPDDLERARLEPRRAPAILADSTPRTVQAFDFEGERGTISNARAHQLTEDGACRTA